MSGELKEHELPGYEFELTGATAIDATRIVDEKYVLSKNYADAYSGLAQEFIEDTKDFIQNMVNFEPTITIDSLDIQTNQNWEELISQIPVSSLTASDYDIQLPTGLEYNFDAEAYVSSLFENLRAEFNDIVLNDHIGLSVATRDAMFLWESEKDTIINQDAKDAILDNMSSRGFEEPSLGIFNTLAQVDIEYQNKQLDKARKITELTEKTSLEMLQKVMEEGVKLEGITQDYWIKFNNLRLEAAKSSIEYGLKIVDVAIKKLEAKISAYEMEVRAYVAKIGAITAVINAEMAIIDAKIKYILAKVQARVAELEAKVRLLDIKYRIGEEATMKLAQLCAQISASALSAFNASASISGSYDANSTESKQFSESYNHTEAAA